jgi:hypothetical protein
MAIMVHALITNLIPDPQKSEEEKLAIGQMPSQYPPMTSHTARAHREIHHHLARITLPMDTSKTMLLPAIRPPPPNYKTFEIPKGGIVIRDNDGK